MSDYNVILPGTTLFYTPLYKQDYTQESYIRDQDFYLTDEYLNSDRCDKFVLTVDEVLQFPIDEFNSCMGSIVLKVHKDIEPEDIFVIKMLYISREDDINCVTKSNSVIKKYSDMIIRRDMNYLSGADTIRNVGIAAFKDLKTSAMMTNQNDIALANRFYVITMDVLHPFTEGYNLPMERVIKNYRHYPMDHYSIKSLAKAYYLLNMYSRGFSRYSTYNKQFISCDLNINNIMFKKDGTPVYIDPEWGFTCTPDLKTSCEPWNDTNLPNNNIYTLSPWYFYLWIPRSSSISLNHYPFFVIVKDLFTALLYAVVHPVPRRLETVEHYYSDILTINRVYARIILGEIDEARQIIKEIKSLNETEQIIIVNAVSNLTCLIYDTIYKSNYVNYSSMCQVAASMCRLIENEKLFADPSPQIIRAMQESRCYLCKKMIINLIDHFIKNTNVFIEQPITIFHFTQNCFSYLIGYCYIRGHESNECRFSEELKQFNHTPGLLTQMCKSFSGGKTNPMHISRLENIATGVRVTFAQFVSNYM